MSFNYIERKRKLPYRGTLFVSKGQRVNCTDIIGEMNYYPGMVKKINISKQLAIKPEKINSVLTVKKGDPVKLGEVIAFNTQWFKDQIVVSPDNGIIGMVSKYLGILYLRKLTKFNSDKYEVHNVEQILGVSPKIAEKSISIKVGQAVSPGQIIASIIHKNNNMCLNSITTNVFGTVTDINDNIIKIKNTQISKYLKSYLSGEVICIDENYSVTIRSKVIRITGNYGIGGEKCGVLKVTNKKILTSDDILPSDNGKIILTRGYISKSAILKAAETNVTAIIGSSSDLSIIRNYVGSNFIPSITGAEDVATGLILINGFGHSLIKRTIFDLLSKFEGNNIALNGTTHIRAGAIRPEVLIFKD